MLCRHAHKCLVDPDPSPTLRSAKPLNQLHSTALTCPTHQLMSPTLQQVFPAPQHAARPLPPLPARATWARWTVPEQIPAAVWTLPLPYRGPLVNPARPPPPAPGKFPSPTPFRWHARLHALFRMHFAGCSINVKTLLQLAQRALCKACTESAFNITFSLIPNSKHLMFSALLTCCFNTCTNVPQNPMLWNIPHVLLMGCRRSSDDGRSSRRGPLEEGASQHGDRHPDPYMHEDPYVVSLSHV